jgi:hypothetical protein
MKKKAALMKPALDISDLSSSEDHHHQSPRVPQDLKKNVRTYVYFSLVLLT